MMWFFAVLVVAVLGGVAVVASGRGGSMAEAYDDRPDALVPADRPLVASDLRRVRFTTAFRGYRMSEVDALLDRLSAELDLLDARRFDLAADSGSGAEGIDHEPGRSDEDA
jgi:DivIVA domain-containing protein